VEAATKQQTAAVLKCYGEIWKRKYCQ
jgi:hypothetical protein